MGSSPILIRAGNKLIGGLSVLGAGGCEFKSHFFDIKSMLREYVGISNFYGLLLTERDNFKLLKNWSEFLGRHLLRWMVSPSFFKF